MAFSELYKSIYVYCKKHAGQCIFVVLALILAFGFHATHYSYHADMLVDEYYNGTVLIGAGRFSAPLINYFTNWMAFAPFWHTVLMAIILFLSGLVLGLVLNKSTGDKLSDKAIFVFWIIFSTFPIICYQITYPILSVVFPYILIGISLWLVLPMINGDKVALINIVSAVLLLTVSVDMYESHATVYLTVYFAAVLLKYIFNEENRKFKEIFTVTVKLVLLLAVAIVVDWFISKLLCYIFCDTFDFWYDANTMVAWTNDSFIDVLKWLFRELIGQYVIAAVSNYNIFIFDFTIFVGFILFIAISIKRRNALPIILFAGMSISSMSMAIILGSAPGYRMSQAMPVLVAVFVMIVVKLLPQKAFIKNLTCFALCVMVLNQTLVINRYTVLNYERYQYENNILENIAVDLAEYSIEDKAVLFIRSENYTFPHFYSTPLSFENPITNTYKKIMCLLFDKIIPQTTYKRLDARFGKNLNYDLDNAENVARFFNEDILLYYPFNNKTQSGNFTPEIYKAFDILGYDLIVAKEAISSDHYIYDKICEQYKYMPSYPNDGYILEDDDKIIVKIYG